MNSPVGPRLSPTLSDAVVNPGLSYQNQNSVGPYTLRCCAVQRVSIGRAIVRQPRIFLMDEPLSSLDAKLREILRAELKDLQMKLAATFLYVTHDQVEAMSMGDRVGVLNRGRIVQVGTPHEIYNRPRDTFVATFVGSPAMNLFAGAIRDGRLVAPGGLEIPIGAGLAPPVALRAGRVTLGVRSEDVTVGSGGGLEGQVYAVENHGVEKIVTLKVDEQLVKVTVPAQMAIEVDSTVPFTFNPRKLHFFDAESGGRLDT
jgi:multiple sugar transport system ATP-binding protein